MVFGIVSCTEGVIYHEYKATPVEGWEMIDTLSFRIDSIHRTGTYSIEIGVRTSEAVGYPFQTLWLEIKQNWFADSICQMFRCDTLSCKLALPDGGQMGNGIGMRQYHFDLDTVHLSKGMNGHIRLRHLMRRNILPGVSDIGVKIYHAK